MMIDLVVWAQYINVTDTQTDSRVAIANATPTHCVGRQKTSGEKNAQWSISSDNRVISVANRGRITPRVSLNSVSVTNRGQAGKTRGSARGGRGFTESVGKQQVR